MYVWIWQNQPYWDEGPKLKKNLQWAFPDPRCRRPCSWSRWNWKASIIVFPTQIADGYTIMVFPINIAIWWVYIYNYMIFRQTQTCILTWYEFRYAEDPAVGPQKLRSWRSHHSPFAKWVTYTKLTIWCLVLGIIPKLVCFIHFLLSEWLWFSQIHKNII